MKRIIRSFNLLALFSILIIIPAMGQLSLDIGYSANILPNNQLNPIIQAYNNSLVNEDVTKMKSLNFLNGFSAGISTYKLPINFNIEYQYFLGNRRASNIQSPLGSSSRTLIFNLNNVGIGMSSDPALKVVLGCFATYGFSNIKDKAPHADDKVKINSGQIFGIKPWIGYVFNSNSSYVGSLRLYYYLPLTSIDLTDFYSVYDPNSTANLSSDQLKWNSSMWGLSFVICNRH